MSPTRDEDWLPDDVDFDTPSAARLYDYYLGVSHASGDTLPSASGAAELYRNSQNSAHLRSHAEMRELLADYTLQDPGLVFLPEWEPEHPADAEDAASCSFYGALARP